MGGCSSKAPASSSTGIRDVTDLHQGIVNMEYAVRGKVVIKAAELQKRLAAGEAPGDFKELVPCNIGNPHAVKQPPVSFYREVASALYHPKLNEEGVLDASGLYAPDVLERAREYHACTGGNGVGAYTDSIGLKLVREQVAAFIEERDGFPCNPAHLALTTGASEGVKRTIGALIRGPYDAILIPRPQYPLYSASVTMAGGQAVYYDLDESRGWTVSLSELERSAKTARDAAGCTGARALCVINPGNPVGAVLGESDVAMMICFAARQKLVLLADEVYQANVYKEGAKFCSFKGVLRRLQAGSLPIPSGADGSTPVCTASELGQCQLISYHSTSKGLIGECGERGGYMEMVGFPDEVVAQFTKVAATSLSSGTIGQIFVGLMVRPPKPGDPSYALFKRECDAIYEGLCRRARHASKALNAIPGISSAEIEGAMYAFPSIRLPDAYVAHANSMNSAADELWCLELLEATGIVCVPGSGFKQIEGTWHFRVSRRVRALRGTMQYSTPTHAASCRYSCSSIPLVIHFLIVCTDDHSAAGCSL